MSEKKMIRINRVDLLQCLQTVQPGLSPKDIVEQSSCFVFTGGQVLTFNDEVACRMKSPLGDFEGAVSAFPLITLLSKLPEDEIQIEAGEGEMIVHGKKRKSGITMEQEITLPITTADKPGSKWTELDSDFVEAIKLCLECAGRDESKFALTCIHIHPKWIESCDNFQMARFRLKTGVKEKCLIRRDAIKYVALFEMSQFNETDSWIHFRDPTTGLVLSCRRYIEEYPDLKPVMDFSGKPAQLPKGLGEAAEKAEIFSSENVDSNQVRIDLRKGKLRIKGVGNSGWYAEVKKLRYDGPDLAFQIGPKLLKELTRKHTECEITEGRLKVDGGKWMYVTALEVVKDGESSDEEKTTEEGEADE